MTDPSPSAPQRSLTEWQRAFRDQPLVYWTEHYGGAPTGNFYVSREAAQVEVDWRKEHFPRERTYIHCASIHSLDLSVERWRK